MATTALQLLGLTLCVIGWVGEILTCALPMWRVTAFIGNSLVITQTIWEGLWMNCVVQSAGQIQCKVYDSMLAIPWDLQAVRGLAVISVLLALLALTVGVVGAKCTKCLEEGSLKSSVSLVAGALFCLAGFVYFIPVCWTANSIIRDFYNPAVPDPHKRELGPALYFGWGAAALLVLGGAVLVSGSRSGSNPNFDSGSRDSSLARGAPTLPAERVKGYV
ncbi:claudin-4-like [Acipenser ruthenus]|uniref:claudin-4-like n=1 Tax=Acipenser ruthenus TaxID=7906 RepID=UPI00274070EA|nr:claudin-4-like [Acipenser ruthenus]